MFAGNFSAASNVAGVGIVTPTIVAQTSASNTAATFVTYDAVKGFIPATSATEEVPTTSFATTNVNQVLTLGAGPTSTLNPLVDVYALQTAGNINAGTAGDTIRFDGGGLIINGANGSNTIGANLTFATVGAPQTPVKRWFMSPIQAARPPARQFCRATSMPPLSPNSVQATWNSPALATCSFPPA